MTAQEYYEKHKKPGHPEWNALPFEAKRFFEEVMKAFPDCPPDPKVEIQRDTVRKRA